MGGSHSSTVPFRRKVTVFMKLKSPQPVSWKGSTNAHHAWSWSAAEPVYVSLVTDPWTRSYSTPRATVPTRLVKPGMWRPLWTPRANHPWSWSAIVYAGPLTLQKLWLLKVLISAVLVNSARSILWEEQTQPWAWTLAEAAKIVPSLRGYSHCRGTQRESCKFIIFFYLSKGFFSQF